MDDRAYISVQKQEYLSICQAEGRPIDLQTYRQLKRQWKSDYRDLYCKLSK
ncbi:hypothetical protein [Bacillus sp. 1P06AnD]|uniref:hypothetical protein n=1 Tax=Bacillus sp. 1P06AnD TaxID=3132208 RepID=UPI0039A2A852